jgi:hypothetical protein
MLSARLRLSPLEDRLPSESDAMVEPLLLLFDLDLEKMDGEEVRLGGSGGGGGDVGGMIYCGGYCCPGKVMGISQVGGVRRCRVEVMIRGRGRRAKGGRD